MVHEFEHVLSRITGTEATQNTDELNSEDYLMSKEETMPLRFRLIIWKISLAKKKQINMLSIY